MAGTKISKKVQFLPYFPYGYCSKLATTIEGRDNPYASMFLLGDNPDATLLECERHRKRALDKAHYLCKKGYAKDTTRTCGIPRMSRSFRYLTKLGLAVMMEAPDEAVVDDISASVETSSLNGKIKGDHFRASKRTYADLRDTLSECAPSQDKVPTEHFNQLLLDAVIKQQATPMSYAIGLVATAQSGTCKYSQNQLYNIWRLSHVNAMFLANNHLTYLDRRPYDTGFAVDGITDAESYQAYTQKYGNTIASITYYALANWYRNNPNYYQITQQLPDSSESARDAWLHTPAIYSTRELPHFDEHNPIKITTAKGNPMMVDAVHIGLATGEKVNYICYHGRPGPFKWITKRERATKGETEEAVRLMKTQCPDMVCRDTIDFALYFCSSIHQFVAIFARTQEKHITGKKLSYLTDAPYASIHVIPVNDSGTFQLWCLMKFSPLETEQMIHNNLVDSDIGFSHAPDRYYPLTYRNKRVFSGYTMDITKINNALEDHLDGFDFYICCFPDQVPWYRKLFPGKTFL